MSWAERSRPGDETEAAKSSLLRDDSSVGVDGFLAGLLTDLITAGMAEYWRRRAEELEAARPVPGDYTGAESRAATSARWHRLTEAAAACRNKAELIEAGDVEVGTPDVSNVLAEVAA